MRYIADVLTGLRALSAMGILLAGLYSNWNVAVVLFIIGALSDAFDGPAARRWPYTNLEASRYWWRKDPHLFDNSADLLLSGATLIVLSLHYLVWWQAALVVAGIGMVSFVIQAIVDRTGPSNPALAERIDVAHGWLFGLELAPMLVLLTITAGLLWLLPLYAIVVVPLLWFKRDRMTSRSESSYGA